jgi:hypothetical protein
LRCLEAPLGEAVDGALQEGSAGRGALVSVRLDVAVARAVVDRAVRESVARAALVAPGLGRAAAAHG